MRSRISMLGTVCLAFGASVASAQPPAPAFAQEVPPPPAPVFESPEAPAFERPAFPAAPTGQIYRRPVNNAHHLIYERAAERARQRDARLEAKRWAGYSPSRPPVRMGHYSADLNQHLAYPYPWGAFAPVGRFPY